MKTTTVYIVESVIDYEGSRVLHGYARQEDADAFAKRCNDHNDIHPDCPAQDASDQEWEDYEVARSKWDMDHPNPGGCTMESYVVTPMTIHTP